MKKRILALLLTLLMLAPSLLSCSETTTEETDAQTPSAEETTDESVDPAAEETEERLKPNIPETADFGGDDIRFIFWNISFGQAVLMNPAISTPKASTAKPSTTLFTTEI